MLKNLLLLACSFSFFLTSHSQSLDWVVGFGGLNDCTVLDVSQDALGNSYLLGTFTDGSLDFDPGPGTDVQTSNPSALNLFLSKYDAAGNYIETWTRDLAANSIIAIIEVMVSRPKPKIISRGTNT